MNSLARQNMEVLALYLFENDGRPRGRERDYRLTAERQLSENLFCDSFGRVRKDIAIVEAHLARRPGDVAIRK